MHKLHYINDKKPGFTRKLVGKHFAYYDSKGKKITDKAVVDRINSLVIPPAYKDVWICPLANGHLQATGMDAKGRKQYRYHPDWRAEREANKFDHILFFGEKLPHIRKCIEKDMQASGMGHDKIMATIVQLLEKTLIRIGNSEYAQTNQSYGLTTLHNKHVKVHGADITFQFKGKSGKEWKLSLHDKRIAAVVKRCEHLPGHELFKYINDNGDIVDVTSTDVNAYLKEVSGEDFTAKDFRTWSATVLAALALREFEKFTSEKEAKKNVLRAIETVAKRLGNTPTICRKSYIHPEVIDAYLDGELVQSIKKEIDKEMKEHYDTLNPQEVMVLSLLRKRLRASPNRAAKA